MDNKTIRPDFFGNFILENEKAGKRGEKTLPFADLSTDFIACPEMDGEVLKLYSHPCRLKAGIFMLCLEGEIQASVNLSVYKICKGDFVSILPGSIIQYHSHTPDLRIGFLGFASGFLGDMSSFKTTMDFFPVMMEHPVIRLPEQTVLWFHDYFELMGRATTLNPVCLHPEIVRCILCSVLYGIGFIYRKHSWEAQVVSRSEEIYKQLLRAIMKYYRQERGVVFYAGQLNISPQHLTATIKQVTGKSVSELITDMVIIDAKAQLKSTHLAIQEIAYSLNFNDVSSFGKYFKRYVGMSPQKYRES